MKQAATLFFDRFSLDVESRRLWSDTGEVLLPPKAIDLLIYLAQRPGQIVSRDQIMEALWQDTFTEDHALSVQIAELRKALQDDSKSPKYIETRHRRGYRFIAEVREAGDKAEAFGALAGVGHITKTERAVRGGGGQLLAGLSGTPETLYARSGDVNIAYQVVGEGPIDLVFVMGWVSHLEYFWREPSFARFLRRLASFSRLILFDKRGTGMSDRVLVSELPTLEQRMDDLRAVMQAIGSERAVLCGVSEGGPMSALFAATYPEKTAALVMFGTYARRLRDIDYPWGPTREERDRYCREIEEHWGGPVGVEERAPSMAFDRGFRDWWATYLRMGASPGAAVALTRMNAEIDVRRVLPTIRCPTLVIHRSADRCLLLEEGRYVANLIPGARFVELPGEDHLPFVGDQDSVLDEIEQFLTVVRGHAQPETVLVTVLFADLSEALGQSEGERFLADVQNQIEWFRGRGMDLTTGRPLATFDGPARAIRCATAICGMGLRRRLAIRTGVHTGECSCVAGKPLQGHALEIGRVLLEMAGPGEVLVTSTVHDLVAGSGLHLTERGRLTMENTGDCWPVFRVLPSQLDPA